MSVLKKPLKLALVQPNPTYDREANLARVKELFYQTKAENPDVEMIILPEHFSYPCKKELHRQYAEKIGEGIYYPFLKSLATDLKVTVIGGTFPELDEDGKRYNTTLTFDPTGALIGKHRKVHLFDIDIPGRIVARESDTFTPGSEATLFDVEGFGKMGQAICYDIRFPELATIAARKDAFAMVYPSAFNTVTGPMHWELLARARALDNQMYVIMSSAARGERYPYQIYGHSLVVSPNGDVIAEAGEGEEVVVAELDPAAIAHSRATIPVRTQRRFDIYNDVSLKASA